MFIGILFCFIFPFGFELIKIHFDLIRIIYKLKKLITLFIDY